MSIRNTLWLILAIILLGTNSQATPLAPLKNTDTLVDEVATFLMSDVGRNGIRIDDGDPVPPYFYHFGVFDGNGLWSPTGVYPGYASVSYPGYTASIGIDAFLAYWRYTGDPEALTRAVHYADWILRHLTPGGDLWGRVPYSTQTDGIMGGGWDGEAIETDKPPMFGLRLFDLYDVTGDTKYLAAADTIAMVLVANQLSGAEADDGRWPWRVRPSDGLVTQDYSSHLVPAVRFLTAAGERFGEPAYTAAADRAWAWILANPLNPVSPSFQRWEGFYEDQSPDMQTGFRDHYSAHQTIDELLIRRPAGWQDSALGVMDWVRSIYLVNGPGTEVSDYWPCTYEWNGWLHATFASTMQFAHTARLLFDALDGDARQDPTLLELANGMTLVTTHGQNTRDLAADGRMFTTVKDIWSDYNHTSWYEQNFNTVIYMLGMMGLETTLAPSGEDHVLTWATPLSSIDYAGAAVVYDTVDGTGEEVLKMTAKPTEILADGLILTEVSDLVGMNDGWTWDASLQLVRVRHEAGPVEVWRDVASETFPRSMRMSLGLPSPNPANPMIMIPLLSEVATNARVTIVDTRGRLVRKLWQGQVSKGRMDLRWDGCDRDGRVVSSGSYVVLLEGDDVMVTRTISVIR